MTAGVDCIIVCYNLDCSAADSQHVFGLNAFSLPRRCCDKDISAFNGHWSLRLDTFGGSAGCRYRHAATGHVERTFIDIDSFIYRRDNQRSVIDNHAVVGMQTVVCLRVKNKVSRAHTHIIVAGESVFVIARDVQRSVSGHDDLSFGEQRAFLVFVVACSSVVTAFVGECCCAVENEIQRLVALVIQRRTIFAG